MRVIISPSIVLCALALGACETPEPVPLSGDISGTWQGERWQGRARVLWTTRQAEDGRIDIEFISCFNGDMLTHERQIGTGTLVDGVWDIRIESVEYRDMSREDVVSGAGFEHRYEFVEISEQRMRYRSEETGTRYDIVRVADDARPECPPPRIKVQSDRGDGSQPDAWITRGIDILPVDDAQDPVADDSDSLKNPATAD